MSPRVEIEWTGRSDFAEAAEAAGISTSDCAALLAEPGDGYCGLLYTTDTDDDEARAWWYVSLHRGGSGILRRASSPIPTGDPTAELRERIERGRELEL